MGRHSKAQKAELLRKAEELARRRPEASDDELFTPTQSPIHQKSPVKASPEINNASMKKVKVKKPKKATVEDQTHVSQDDLAIAHRLRNGNNTEKLSKFDLAKLVEKLAIAVSAVGDSEDVQALFIQDELLDAESIAAVHKNCHIVKSSLEHLGNVSDIPNIRPASTSEHYGKYMLYHPENNKLLYLLTVAEVFQANHTAYSRRKTFGFVRAKGSIFPLQCAISGWTNVLEYHPRMLDTEFWLGEVKLLAMNLDHDFQPGPWDRVNKREGGDGYASHVEPTLMLFYACHLAAKVFGPFSSIRKATRSIWRLRGRKFEAELVLNKAPCRHCKKFQQLIEDYTGITFRYVIIDNVAEVFPEKDKVGFELYPRFAFEDNQQDIKEAIEIMLEYGVEPKKATDRIAIEIPVAPEPQTPRPNVHQPQSRSPQSQVKQSKVRTTVSSDQLSNSRSATPIFSRVVTTSKTIQKKMIQSYAYEDPDKTIMLVDSDNESVYEPPTPSQRKIYRPQYTTPRKPTAQWTPPTPDSQPFSPEAVRRANELKKKNKKREANHVQESLAAAKRARWTGYIVDVGDS